GWTTAPRSCPRSGASPCAGVARWRAPPRPCQFLERRTAGTSPLPLPRCPLSRSCGPTEREAVANSRHYLKAEKQAEKQVEKRAEKRLAKAQKRLAKAQKRLSRCKKGNKRWRKAARLRACLLARKHQTVRRQRRDLYHKTALALLRQYDTLPVQHPLCGRSAGRQLGTDPSPGQKHLRCG